MYIWFLCKIWGSLSVVAEGPVHLGCHTVSLAEYFQLFQKKVMLSSANQAFQKHHDDGIMNFKTSGITCWATLCDILNDLNLYVVLVGIWDIAEDYFVLQCIM
jgi:hypothetical protein